MKLLGFDVKREGHELVINREPRPIAKVQAPGRSLWSIVKKALPQPTQPMSGFDRGNWWWPIIREPFTGAWQRNVELRPETVVSYFAVYACIDLIASDVGKLRLRLMQLDERDIAKQIESASFSPVLRKPNHYQTRAKFIEHWIISKLLHGNTYVLKERDNRGVVVRLYILDPTRVKPLVAPDGSVFYEMPADNLSGVGLPVRIPASEIIHDVMVTLFHPLCGVSPLLAAGLPVVQGLNIQKNSAMFFEKGSRPSGILSSPVFIDDPQLEKMKADWENNFSGENAGRVAILQGGLKYEPMGVPAEQAQLIEQLKWSAENVCSVFHVPPFMIGIGAPPSFDNVEALNQQYYSQCLQRHIEAIESLLDDGLALPSRYETEFNLDDLLRMDTKTKVTTAAEGVKSSIFAINEARAKFNLPPKKGGDIPLSQQQNWPIDILAERPPPTAAPGEQLPAPADDNEPDQDESEPVDVERILAGARQQYH